VREILAEWNRWNEECGALNEALEGVDEALEAIEELVPKHRLIAKRIAATLAKTMSGLQVMALMVEILDDDEDGDD
jgi:hypothetical protein